MSGIVLSGAVRSNLLALQSTAELQAKVQERLATGKKVNSALDNPSNFFTAAGLSRRANDLSALLDGMQQGIKTLEAADNAMKSITKTIETMQANIRQARQDKSFKGVSYDIDTSAVTTGITTAAAAKKVSFSGGAVGTTPVNVDLSTAQGVLTASTNYANLDFAEAGTDKIDFKIALNGAASPTQVTVEQGAGANTLKVTVGGTVTDNIAVAAIATVTGTEMANALTQGFAAANLGITVSGSTGAKLTFTGTATDGSKAAVAMSNLVISNGGAGTAITAANFGFTAGGAGVSAGGAATISNVTAKTVDALVSEINANTSLTDKVKASNDGGKLRIENDATDDLTVTGVGATSGKLDGSVGTGTIGGNDVRKNLMGQFNDLRTQLDKLAGDGSYNGINLLKADKLKITFNEFGTSSIEIQAKNTAGVVRGIDTSAGSLNIGVATAAEFSDDAALEARMDALGDSLTTLQAQSSSFGSSLSIVQIRQEFTKEMINTLNVGADNLTLADQNEEGANLLALNTRQQLSQTALSLAAQAQQAVLRLFG
jgi:flagellin-like hook-associated protein FlgL